MMLSKALDEKRGRPGRGPWEGEEAVGCRGRIGGIVNIPGEGKGRPRWEGNSCL